MSGPPGTATGWRLRALVLLAALTGGVAVLPLAQSAAASRRERVNPAVLPPPAIPANQPVPGRTGILLTGQEPSPFAVTLKFPVNYRDQIERPQGWLRRQHTGVNPWVGTMQATTEWVVQNLHAHADDLRGRIEPRLAAIDERLRTVMDRIDHGVATAVGGTQSGGGAAGTTTSNTTSARVGAGQWPAPGGVPAHFYARTNALAERLRGTRIRSVYTPRAAIARPRAR